MGDAMVGERRVYRENDADIPSEFSDLLVRMLVHHLENSTNRHYTELLSHLWERCMTLAPEERLKTTFAKLMQQEVEHGVITARILAGLGVGTIKQYLFHLPIDTFCDMAYFNALGDRVGCYIGETWEDVPYEPLLNVAERLHKDEVFHATFGLSNLRRVCADPAGLAEANEKIKIWWPAALDMFGRSDSEFSDAYVRWGLRKLNNAQLRQQYIADTRPLLEEIGITVPADTANRRFL
ncbi:phenylacetic acid degradation protein [Candidatus Frankia alpina]|uniref:Phenylacetic acid degradation protein n=2 Tax=Candidatus Frankia alpina TaxID=2699483 RepID=A0A4S5CGE6_9ACTN|nr:phenylacetic acid degradation protein [Candidatus Frankia alpina]